MQSLVKMQRLVSLVLLLLTFTSLISFTCPLLITVSYHNGTTTQLLFQHVSGDFNPDNYNTTATLSLTPSFDPLLCQTSDSHLPPPHHILLATRGLCAFLLKTHLAQEAFKASGLIIGDNQDSSDDDLNHMFMSSDHLYKVDIPTVLISHQSYKQLLFLLDESNAADSSIHRLTATIDRNGEIDYGAEPFPLVDPMLNDLSILLPLLASLATVVAFVLNYRQWQLVQQIIGESPRRDVQPPLAQPVQAQATLPTINQSLQQGAYQAVSQHDDDVQQQQVASSQTRTSFATSSSSFNDLHDLFDESDEWFRLTYREKIEEMLLQFTHLLGKPSTILYVNGVVYAVEVISAALLLLFAWQQRCSNSLHSLVALFLCRATVGFSILFWQTRASQHFPPPNAALVFLKNWGDYCLLFTGPMSHPVQGGECRRSDELESRAVQVWVIAMYCAFAARLVLFLLLRTPWCSIDESSSASVQSLERRVSADVEAATTADNQYATVHAHTLMDSSLRHTLSVLLKHCLDLLNGGFFCAGALDTARPATALDLRHIPIRRYYSGMLEDNLCSICYCEYESGDRLRKLFCCHTFHQQCVDVWLLRHSSCPLCRQRCDEAEYQRRKQLWMQQRAIKENNQRLQQQRQTHNSQRDRILNSSSSQAGTSTASLPHSHADNTQLLHATHSDDII